jgi:hypothetical protein
LFEHYYFINQILAQKTKILGLSFEAACKLGDNNHLS